MCTSLLQSYRTYPDPYLYVHTARPVYRAYPYIVRTRISCIPVYRAYPYIVHTRISCPYPYIVPAPVLRTHCVLRTRIVSYRYRTHFRGMRPMLKTTAQHASCALPFFFRPLEAKKTHCRSKGGVWGVSPQLPKPLPHLWHCFHWIIFFNRQLRSGVLGCAPVSLQAAAHCEGPG